MISRGKKNLGAGFLAALMLLSSAGVSQLVKEVIPVEASVRQDVLAVHNSVEHLRKSLKNNYLGIKNVGQWQSYIKTSRNLNNKLPNGSSKNKYNERINTSEALVNAVAHISHLEASMDKNAHIMKNVPQWEGYIESASKSLDKVDLSQFENQYNNLKERLEVKIKQVNKIKGSGNNEGNGSGNNQQGESPLSFKEARLYKGASIVNGENIPVDSEFEIVFDRGVSEGTKFWAENKSCITMIDSEGKIIPLTFYSVEGYNADDKKRIIGVKPSENLTKETKYTINISKNLTANNGKKLGKDITIDFTTVKSTNL